MHQCSRRQFHVRLQLGVRKGNGLGCFRMKGRGKIIYRLFKCGENAPAADRGHGIYVRRSTSIWLSWNWFIDMTNPTSLGGYPIFIGICVNVSFIMFFLKKKKNSFLKKSWQCPDRVDRSHICSTCYPNCNQVLC